MRRESLKSLVVECVCWEMKYEDDEGIKYHTQCEVLVAHAELCVLFTQIGKLELPKVEEFKFVRHVDDDHQASARSEKLILNSGLTFT